MSLTLKLAALAAAFIAGVFLAHVVVSRRRLKKLFATLGDAGSTLDSSFLPARIELAREPSPRWRGKEEVEAAVRSLRALGFEEVGAFRAPPLRDLLLFGLVHRAECACAVVHDSSVAGVWTDVSIEYASGDQLMVTGSFAGGLARSRPGVEKVFERAEPARLFEVLKARRGPGPYRPATPEGFARSFEESYGRDMDWFLNGKRLAEAQR